jgi:hypothetical protein
MTWGRASLLALVWAIAAVLLAGPVYLITLELPLGGFPILLGLPTLAAVLAGFIHRDGRIVALTALFGLLLAGAFFAAFLVIALNGLPGP